VAKQQWLDEATQKIRFTPDRDAVRRELAAHIEDLTDHYAAAGASPEEAEAQALTEMGSASDIAAELGRIHRPWWGWLWQVSRYILLFAAFYALLYSFPNMSSRRIFSDFRPPEPVSYTSETAFLVDAVQGWAKNPSGHYQVEVLEEFKMGGRADWGSYRFTAPVCWTETRNWDAGTQHWLVLYLRCSTWKLWAPASTEVDMVIDPYRSAVDSDGNTYNYYSTSKLVGAGYSGNPGVTWYRIEIKLPQPEAPDWVEIPLGLGDYTITVNLAKGVVS